MSLCEAISERFSGAPTIEERKLFRSKLREFCRVCQKECFDGCEVKKAYQLTVST